MPRNPRVEYAGAVYHVMCRGDRGERIYQSDSDRRHFLDTLAEVCERTGFLVHSYVLMSNHYHWLLETPEPNLVAGMKWFQGTYTQRFNARHGQRGHVFQGRYKAIPVDTSETDYFRTVSDYIHLNPARAGLLMGDKSNVEDYPWSSYPRFVGKDSLPPWLRRDRVFGAHHLSDAGTVSRRRYSAYMKKRVAEIKKPGESEELQSEWSAIRRGWFVGDDGFRDYLYTQISQRVRGLKRTSFAKDGLKLHDEQMAKRHLGSALTALEVELPTVRKMPKNNPVKQALAWWVKKQTVIGDDWICRTLDMGSRVNISRAVGAFRETGDKERKRLAARLYKCTD